MAFSVLLVEDDPVIAEMLGSFFRRESCESVCAADAAQAEAMLHARRFDAVVLDIDLPDGDGLALCKQIRTRHDSCIVMSTAYRDIDRKLEALTGGADDYITKPYDPRELLARIQLILRHREQPLRRLDFEIDDGAKRIYQRGEALKLTAAEYEILALFITRGQQVLSRYDIANSISAHRFESEPESINVLLSRLRKKIGAEHIVTLRGLGYKFVP